jgi:hypothetical protein
MLRLLPLALAAAIAHATLPPKLAALVERAKVDPAGTAADLKAHTKAYQVKDEWTPSENPAEVGANQYPIVVTHGMGDSCFNKGKLLHVRGLASFWLTPLSET